MENWNNKDWLYEQHIEKHKSVTAIAKECHKRVNILREKMIDLGIPVWSGNDAYTKLSQEDEQNIIKLYCEDNLSALKISKIYNIDDSRVKRILVKNGVDTRTRTEAQFAQLGKEPDPRLFDKEWLYDAHWNKKMSCKDIGELLGSDPCVVRNHMNRLGIATRNNSESKIGLMVGDKHPNWKGGKTSLNHLLREYFNINIAPLAAKRDEYTCQKCGKTHTILNVHHKKHFSDIVNEIALENPNVDYSTPEGKIEMYRLVTSDDRFLDLDNLVTLCKDCHILEHSKKID